jgi:hypothetical protein
MYSRLNIKIKTVLFIPFSPEALITKFQLTETCVKTSTPKTIIKRGIYLVEEVLKIQLQ